MTWALLAMRKSQLQARKSQYEARLLEISQKIQDMADFSASIADGKITYQEMATAPSSMFGTQLGFMNQSALVAGQSANIKANAFINNYNAIQQQTGGQYNYAITQGANMNYMQNGQIQPYLVYNEIYKEELENFAKQYAQQINKEEEALQAEKLRIETQLKAIEAEYESVDQGLTNNIKNDAIKLC